ncbi:LPXTG-motif cell wall anchor domain-containing protein/TQXA domain-containing protein [Amycolatopsis marina]|uniref:LPXTG-motif cell wall anchor domain-containing protein/TQXA domain-containing protein n=1 Tax=Amycolatopsis marina TaxID=490629 RepID=A0A1I0W0J5_9PSEU|nr:thioester domain-containing protein [Amycolatopsis marina]SFA82235.1 LPXTG-motif cell wall anchor domain-containing protein/TQXA domain-containing protein [Amycolatopsis marina]
MRGKKILARTGAAVLGASMALMSGALPAGADQAQGKLDTDAGVSGFKVNVEGMKNLSTTLFGLRLEGGDLLKTYCVQIEVDIRDEDKDLVRGEVPWDEFPYEHSPFHKNREKINWVLHHGYPVVEADALEALLVKDGATFNDGLTVKEAITATQAAVWRFSDDKPLKKDDPLSGKDDAETEADVLAVYDYLTGEKNVGIGKEPTATLEVSPEEATGEAGSRIGPFTVSTTGEITEIVSELPEGVTLTDAEGAELNPEDVTDGTEVFFDVPDDAEEGSGSFELTVEAAVDTGRLFVAEDYKKRPSQSLIVASSEKTSLSAGAQANWKVAPPVETTPPPVETTAPPTSSEVAAPPTTEAPVNPQANEDDLAQTGFSAMTPLLLGGGLLLAGGATLLLLRRRNAA